MAGNSANELILSSYKALGSLLAVIQQADVILDNDEDKNTKNAKLIIVKTNELTSIVENILKK